VMGSTLPVGDQKMNSKVWLRTFGTVSVLLLAGTGIYATSSFQKYRESLGKWETKVESIADLEGLVPYPDEKNTEALADRVGLYRESVKALSETLKSFQRPLETGVINTGAQLRAKKYVEDFRAFAKENSFAIETESEFLLGFDAYADTVPDPGVVPLLYFQLDAIDHLLRKLVTSGAKSMTSFVRDPIPGESGARESPSGAVMQKYPVRLRFQTDHESLQGFINELANDREFFFIIRVLKVENENQEGSLKQISEDKTSSVGPEKSSAIPIQAEQDARVLMGKERLNLFMAIDICRFTQGDESPLTSPPPPSSPSPRVHR
jgi:hypothetical protein